jgi:pyruvate/2-oxoglutarate dehydrogenase complex dihydrolipoamide dehydrogenase (E3) component
LADIDKPDLCVIGAGSGGLTVAAAARALGASVVLIERGAMGGDCLNAGCVPSKTLIGAAKRAHMIRHSSRFGIGADEPKIDFDRVSTHVREVIAEIAPHDSVERFTAMGVDVIADHAQFVDRRTVTAGGRTIRARRFVIATGSRPAIPDIPGLGDIDYFTNETLFDNTHKPGHLIVLGGGPVGLEMAQAHLRLGVTVTLIDAIDPLSNDDPELVAILMRRLRHEGLEILPNTGVVAARREGADQIALDIKTGADERTITATHLLVATGRQPNIEDLGLEAARIRFDRRGIKVNKGLTTSNRRVYAIGDVAGGMQFTHVAGYHGGLVVRNALFGLPVRENTAIIPWATFTDPEIAHVGLTEPLAKKRHKMRYKVLRWSFAHNDRAQTMGETEGLVKLLTDNGGKILGASVIGPSASETIALFAFAIANGLKVSSLTKFVAPYPTLAEIARRVGIQYYTDKLDNPWLARLMALNRLLP